MQRILTKKPATFRNRKQFYHMLKMAKQYGKNPREIVYGLNDIVIHRVGDLSVLRMNVYVKRFTEVPSTTTSSSHIKAGRTQTPPSP